MQVMFAAAALWGIGLTPALAAEPAYQKLADAGCKEFYTDIVGANSLCRGPDGTPFIVADFDARMSVTFGGVDETSEPPYQTFGHFNSAGETVEWRMEGGKAVAAILRWSIQGYESDPPASVLVVSRVGSGKTPGCIAAYVDAKGNPDANVMAREAAERIAPNIDCSTHRPFYYGKRGPTAPDPVLSEQAEEEE